MSHGYLHQRFSVGFFLKKCIGIRGRGEAVGLIPASFIGFIALWLVLVYEDIGVRPGDDAANRGVLSDFLMGAC